MDNIILLLHQEIQKLIDSQGYLTCLLLVHPEIELLSNVVDDLENRYKFPLLNVGMTLSKALLPIKFGERSRFSRKWFDGELSDISSDPVLMKNIDLLFESSLELDPLQLFRALGRRAKLIVIWPGEFDGTSLSYAVPEHRNYQIWQNPDVQIYRLE